MRIKLLLFAGLRDLVGQKDVELDLPEGASPDDVWAMLRADHPSLGNQPNRPLTAINESYADGTTSLRHGDELAFIPPVAGG